MAEKLPAQATGRAVAGFQTRVPICAECSTVKGSWAPSRSAHATSEKSYNLLGMRLPRAVRRDRSVLPLRKGPPADTLPPRPASCALLRRASPGPIFALLRPAHKKRVFVPQCLILHTAKRRAVSRHKACRHYFCVGGLRQSTRQVRATPTNMAASATLNAGQCQSFQ